MLNELSQVFASLDAVGIAGRPRHQNIQPMGRNTDVLVVSLDEDGKPQSVEVVRADVGQYLLKYAPANNGPGFPGFNLPTPLRTFTGTSSEELAPALKSFLVSAKNKNETPAALSNALKHLFEMSSPRAFTDNQKSQFQRSCGELVGQLYGKLSNPSSDLANFIRLLTIVDCSKPSLVAFAESLSKRLVASDAQYERYALMSFQQVLFGKLDWKNRAADYAAPNFLREKSEQDKDAKQPIYLDLAFLDSGPRIARVDTGENLNAALLKAEVSSGTQEDRTMNLGVDAFTGDSVELQDKFPSPKIAELGPVKLFSVNTKEVRALHRYGLRGSEAFPVSSALTQRMSDALLYLANEDKRGLTCRAIPGAQHGKRDLLIAYLEGAPEGREQLAEMFGGEAESFSDADFSEIAKPVIEMLEGRLASNADLNVRLVAFSSLDPGRRQISLDRRFSVRDVIRAARDWKEGARNSPAISVCFLNKNTNQSMFRSHTTPCPLELASVVNRVWSTDPKSGFTASHQRAISTCDAYDVFLRDSPLAKQKSQTALGLLVVRMSNVLRALGAVKTTRRWIALSDAVRWQSLKTIALLGVLLHQLGHYREDFMQESITQIGRLLAFSDSLHQQYCKHVRKGESPSQLIGNALFSTALEQPVFALARLAERLTPYQAWARTLQSNDPEAGVGLVKYFLGEIAACTAAIHLGELPQRMSDSDKAKLLLGYLGDHSKTESEE